MYSKQFFMKLLNEPCKCSKKIENFSTQNNETEGFVITFWCCEVQPNSLFAIIFSRCNETQRLELLIGYKVFRSFQQPN